MTWRLQVMNNYARERHAFGQPINSFGQIQKHIADSYAEYSGEYHEGTVFLLQIPHSSAAAARAYTYNTAARMDLRAVGNRIDSDGVKLYAARMAVRVAGRAIQVRRFATDCCIELCLRRLCGSAGAGWQRLHG
jgi:isovaleryl-CoA dehydrogenase